MALLNQLTEDLKTAMKAHEKFRVNTIRQLISQLKNAKIDSGEDLSLEQEQEVIFKAAKRRKEAVEAYEKSDRQDLVDNEKQELEIINEYLPKQMSDAEIEKEIENIIASVGASSMKDLGKVMSEAMKKLKGKADGKKVQTMVRTKLA